ncbi:DUF2628 domain-containing protein [Paenibacillus melissococcoides]|uniref:DUF2628 domain-containing protein n=1 Tax=Paenibacillus melissococcoides TaxID=2912268 RepID=A0ABM9GC09_9BACL|nr:MULTISPECIES: DUF2628 domain-containing protein [Paenibacillus]MEB9895171.1 DUF2628 domain-containing protein [Bacillus cereus]CAH8249674.1 DUF2628 domain-containing protein [Paenibacillus melissococcoides]CAH8721509.1 DUF2628 domain-containing protein [Paenibacillus melissococcoides]CAH8721710.1 DUF2628 domain-containing protein [Paenibacillus melissococcoides]GIO82556.1 hypothetical protein J6TS7_61660 [Paenibacillus dendritiformis]
MHVQLVNAQGAAKNVKLGFSWTTFFFGFFPALFRGDLKWAAIMFICAVLFGLFTLGLGAWIPGIIFSFIYNKMYIRELMEKGYRPANAETEAALQAKGIMAQTVRI